MHVKAAVFQMHSLLHQPRTGSHCLLLFIWMLVDSEKLVLLIRSGRGDCHLMCLCVQKLSVFLSVSVYLSGRARAAVQGSLDLRTRKFKLKCCCLLHRSVIITYNIYIVIRETGQFSSKGIINDFIGNLNRLTVSRRFTEQAV